ncbi:hypothetical protein CMI48_00555 [Candidatus Pacearchaeota archaeon]|nr:hypothetical protein [Candidatus Pacearchaeota archaeon]
MISRRGDFTLNRFLGILLAVMALSLFFIAGGKLYADRFDQDVQDAKGVLDAVMEKVGRVKSEGPVTVRGKKGWSLVGWSEGQDRPDKCLGGCLCVCPDSSDLITSCQDGGFCKPSGSKQVLVRHYQPLYMLSTDLCDHLSDLPDRRIYRPFVPLSDQLFELGVGKEDSCSLLAIFSHE